MGATGAGAGTGAAASVFPGIFSFWPTLMWSVVRLFSARIALTVVPCAFAILVSESPDFTVYVSPATPEPVETGPPVIADAPPDDAGIESFCPTFNLVGATPGFAASMALTLTPFFLAIFAKESPFCTPYSAPAISGTGACTGTTTGGAILETSVGGGFVSMTTVFVSTGGGPSLICSRLQP